MRVTTMLLLAALTSACTSKIDDKPKADVKDATGTASPGKTAGGPPLDKANSSIGFIGAKVTDDHEGNFADYTANLGLDGKTPTSLSLEVKTDSVAIEPEKLRGHLMSPDFFDTAKYPTASFASKSITAKADGAATHVVEGVLDLRGVKKEISFPATITVDEKIAKGHAEFTINRKDFGIVYAGMADDLIKDEVLMKIDLAFTVG